MFYWVFSLKDVTSNPVSASDGAFSNKNRRKSPSYFKQKQESCLHLEYRAIFIFDKTYIQTEYNSAHLEAIFFAGSSPYRLCYYCLGWIKWMILKCSGSSISLLRSDFYRYFSNLLITPGYGSTFFSRVTSSVSYFQEFFYFRGNSIKAQNSR